MTRLITVVGGMVLSLALLGSLMPSFAAAQSVPSSAQRCLTFATNLSRGATDASSGGEVSALQSFLNEEGLFPYAPVGVFGPITYNAVVELQERNNIPDTGFVGPITRAFISQTTCGSTVTGTSAPLIQSVTPSYASVGSTVTIYGSGFTNQNVILLNNDEATAVASPNGQTLTFTVPQSLGPNCWGENVCPDWLQLLEPGTYTLTVENSAGVSNAVDLTISGSGGVSTGSLSVESLTPSSGFVGSSVTIYGSGFAQSGNSITFTQEDGAYAITMQNLTSYNGGTELEFTVPSSLLSGQDDSYIETEPGVYNVSVNNGEATAGAGTFTVTSGQTIGTTPILQSLSTYSASVGTTVTIYGSGFTSNNTIYLNNEPIYQAASSDGETLSFVVPAYYGQNCSVVGYCTENEEPISSGTYNLTVGNSYGTSNGLSFTVSANGQIGTGTSAPSIQSVSPTSASPGTTVTIYGSGFTSSNAIYLNTTNVAQGVSSNGQTLSFTVPSLSNLGGYTLTVVNSNGTSNGISFTLLSQGSSSATLTSLSPSSGPVGTTVTLNGSGFYSTNNLITLLEQNGYYFYQAYPVSSSNGITLSFTIPSTLDKNTCVQSESGSTSSSLGTCDTNASDPSTITTPPGVYTVHTSNSNGATLAFDVTQAQTSIPAPSIQSLSPSSGAVGTTITITGSGFTANDIVNFSNGSNYGAFSAVSSNGTSLTFTIPSTLRSGIVCLADQTCTYPTTESGSYTVTVQNENGTTPNLTSNALTFTVTGAPSSVQSSSAPTIQSLSPNSASVGTTVMVSGSGFLANANNTVYLNNEAIAQVSASSGSTLYFTVPSYYSPNCSSNGACTDDELPVGSGTYTLTVGNANGASNGLPITISGNLRYTTQGGSTNQQIATAN